MLNWLLKNQKAIIIPTEIFIAGILVYGYLSFGFPNKPVFWAAFIVAVILTFIIYYCHKRYLSGRKRYGYLIRTITLIGTFVPIVLSMTINFLKPIGSIWLVFLLMINSIYFYRYIIKKEPIPQDPQQTEFLTKPFTTPAKIIYWITMLAVVAIIIALIVLTILGKTDLTGKKTTLELIFAIAAVPFLLIGIFAPRVIKRIWKKEFDDFSVYVILGGQFSFLLIASIMALIIGIADGLFFVALPLILVVAVILIINYPTAERWERLKSGSEKPDVQSLDDTQYS